MFNKTKQSKDLIKHTKHHVSENMCFRHDKRINFAVYDIL